jgi:gliding motility-associated-like protein
MNHLYHRSQRYALALIFCILCGSPLVKAQLVVNPNVTIAQLMTALTGQGLTVSNVSLNCPTGAYGTFNGSSSNIGMTNGILLTTGNVNNAVGPNTIGSATTCNGTSVFDPQLQSLEPLATNDVCILEFDIVPQCNNLQIRFVFGSEEYPEFVNSGFNDAFGFFITGAGPACQPNFYNNTNVATLPNNTTIVSIDNVNNISNNTYYVDNTFGTTVQYDGFTTVLTRNVALCPCTSYHFKIAIGDAGDCLYDSGVFVDFIQCSNSVSATSTSTPAGCSCSGTATATAAGGTSPYTYSWAPSGGTNATATGLCPGTYTCFVSDALSCTTPVQTVVTISGSGISATQSSASVSCNGGSNGSATVNPSGGTSPYTYSWSPGGQTSQTATGLSSGTYTVVITDANGCSTTQTVTVNQPSVLNASTTFTNPTCFGLNNGTASVSASGGTAGYSYNWAPSGGSSATATGLACGSYTVTVTDANGCTRTATATLTCPTQVVANAGSSTNPTCGSNNGSATITGSGGTGTYTYSWAPGGQTSSTATGLGSGTYTVTVTDGNGCTGTQTVTLTNANGPSATLSATGLLCNGQCTGSASSNVTGGTSPYTYSWSNGQTTSAISNLCAGTYTLVATDAIGCTVLQTVTVSQPAVLSVSAAATAPLCSSGTGSVTATGSGGTAPYTYSWSNNQTSATITGVSCGSYTVYITDANGCTQTATAVVTCPSALATNVSSVTNTSCANTLDGSATVNASGGTPGYTYNWVPSGGTNATATGLAPGTYTVTITDANGCTTTATATIGSPPPVLLAASGATTICIGQSANLSASASGGSAPYSYSWAPGNQTTSAVTVSPTTTTTYTVFVTDANGCTGTQQTVTVTVNPPLVLNLAANPTTICAGGSATITANGAGGNGNYTYSWAPSGTGTSVTVTPTGTTTYTVTISDNCGTPVATSTITITVAQPPTACILASDTAGCAPFCVNFTSCGSSAVSWSWTFAGGTPSSSTQQNPSSVCFNTPGLYNVSLTLTSSAGCVGSTTSNSLIHVYPAPVAAFTSGSGSVSGVPANICFTDNSVGATGWLWTSGTNTSTTQNPCFTFADTGTYCVTLLASSQGGCTDTTVHCLRVEVDSFALVIPNVFTPNGDGKNDVFMITAAGIKELEILIYNRWGNQVYDGNALTSGWDGKAKNGNRASDGTYYYVLVGLRNNGEQIEEKGFLTLLNGK